MGLIWLGLRMCLSKEKSKVSPTGGDLEGAEILIIIPTFNSTFSKPLTQWKLSMYYFYW